MQKYKIVQTEDAEKHLIEIKKYVKCNYGANISNKVLSIIKNNILNLSQYPLMYPKYGEKRTYHIMPVYNGIYNVIYQVFEDKETISVFGIYYYAQEINPDTLKEIRLFI